MIFCCDDFKKYHKKTDEYDLGPFVYDKPTTYDNGYDEPFAEADHSYIKFCPFCGKKFDV